MCPKEPLPPTPDQAHIAPSAPPILDAMEALALMDNSTDLYLDIAQAFLQELSGMPQRAQALLQEPDLSEATRMLHTFKGLSLTVGARHLAEVCRQCELQLKELKHNSQPLQEGMRMRLVEALGTHAEQAREAMQAFLATLSAPAEQAPASPGVAGAMADLQALRALLSQSDLRALDCYATLRARHSDWHARLSGLHQALGAFDFAQAVVQCDELIRSLGPRA